MKKITMQFLFAETPACDGGEIVAIPYASFLELGKDVCISMHGLRSNQSFADIREVTVNLKPVDEVYNGEGLWGQGAGSFTDWVLDGNHDYAIVKWFKHLKNLPDQFEKFISNTENNNNNQIANLTQHKPTPEQVESNVTDTLVPSDLLTFDNIPTSADLKARAVKVASYAKGFKQAMIGGAPYFMSYLEQELKSNGIQPLYSFTQRVSVEEVVMDENLNLITKKTSVFKHIGFVEA